ncbi:MAG: hypothetical protein H0W39_12015 [Sphingomonas sp.]|nr:hypothetical protein [Sphingomonas sp.]
MVAFRDDIPAWLYGDSDQNEDDEEEEVVDETRIYEEIVIDVGVTSGADPTVWDPIDVDPTN